jgi:hypothetical protein
MKTCSCKKIIILAILYGVLYQVSFSQMSCSSANQLQAVAIVEGVDFLVKEKAISVKMGGSATIEVLLKNKTSEEKEIPFVGHSLVDFKMTEESGKPVPTIYELLTEKQSKGLLTEEEKSERISYHWFSGPRGVELSPYEERKLFLSLDRKFKFKTKGQFCLEVFGPGSRAGVITLTRTLGKVSIQVD